MTRSLPLLLAALVACDPGLQTEAEPVTGADEGPVDAEDAPIDTAKADGGCPAQGPVADGLLALANDPSVSEAQLDRPRVEGGVGLDVRAAEGIVAARPFDDLAELDAVPYVGPYACRALAEYACNVQTRCGTELSVLTWNLRQFPYTDATEDAVVEYITQTQPAFVGLQEIGDLDAFDRVVDRLPDYVGVLAEPGPFTRVAALVRSDALEITGVEDLFVDDGWPFPRPVLAVRAEVVGARDPIAVTLAVVHLKASGGETNESRRRMAIGELRDWIDEERLQGRAELLVLGDYNDELTTPSDDNVFGDLDESAAGVRWLTDASERDGAYSYVPWERMLDHILVTEELASALAPVHTAVLPLEQTWRDDYLDAVSDHRPVESAFFVPVGS